MFAENLTYLPNTISIYIHWPFCASKCPYCDFNSYVSKESINFKLWEKAYINQLKLYSHLLKGKTIRSVFFGGGTPSLIDPTVVYNILSYIKSLNANKDIVEITLESNPSSIESAKLKEFKEAGVNRISIGVQSFNEKNLKFLKRTHTSKEAINGIHIANEVFKQVSFDLINALPNQSLEDWKKELNTALPFIKSHVSIYELTIEHGTPFFKQKVLPAKTDLSIEMFNYTKNFLSEHNIYPYEISNYSKPQQQSLHNLHCWEGGLYLGIGPGAHGRIIENGKIYATMCYKNPVKWLNLALENKNVLSEKQVLNLSQRLYELFILNLRLYKEITPMIYSYISEESKKFLKQEGFLLIKENKLYLTNRGRLQLNTIIEFLVNQSHI